MQLCANVHDGEAARGGSDEPGAGWVAGTRSLCGNRDWLAEPLSLAPGPGPKPRRTGRCRRGGRGGGEAGGEEEKGTGKEKASELTGQRRGAPAPAPGGPTSRQAGRPADTGTGRACGKQEGLTAPRVGVERRKEEGRGGNRRCRRTRACRTRRRPPTCRKQGQAEPAGNRQDKPSHRRGWKGGREVR